MNCILRPNPIMDELLTRLESLPWIQNASSTSAEILGVPRHNRQSVHHSGGRHHAVRVGQSFFKIQAAPLFRYQMSHGKNSIPKLRNRSFQPSLKNFRLHGIFLPLEFDSKTNFAQTKNADIQVICGDLIPPPHHIRICTATFANFRENIRVQKVAFHSSRGGRLERLLGRSKDTSSSTSESAERWSLKSYRAAWSARPSFSARIRRCSSSAETPCSAARSFSAFTSVSGIFLTSNCAMSAQCYHCYQSSIKFPHAP
jgi:hypothetical protein